MMLIRRNLLILLLCMARPSLWALTPAVLGALFCRMPLFQFPIDFLPFVFVFLHSLAIISRLGRPHSACGAFLYGRGFSRDALWAHQMLASVLAALAVWLPVAILIWTPARAIVQDQLLRNPYYPLLGPREAMLPWRWLAAYGLFLPVIHYDWIRRAQPVRGATSGSWLALALASAVFTVWNTPGPALFHETWFQALLWGSGTLLALSLLLAGWRLHGELEVLP